VYAKMRVFVFYTARGKDSLRSVRQQNDLFNKKGNRMMQNDCRFISHKQVNKFIIITFMLCYPVTIILSQNQAPIYGGKPNRIIYISQRYFHLYPKGQQFPISIDSIKMSENTLSSADDSLNKSSSINIRTRPSGAEIFVDTVYVGKSPVSIKDIAEGLHIVHCKLKNFRELSTNCDVESGLQQTLIITFVPAFGLLSLITKPPDALVTVDTFQATYSPLSDIQLSVGYHSISISHPNYETPIQGSFYVYPGYHTTIEAGEKRFSSQTVLCSALVPGFGQTLDHSYLKGSLEFLLALGSGFYISNCYSYRNQKQSNYEFEKAQYAIATNETDALIARTNMTLAATDLDRANNRLKVSYWILGGTYAISIVDALLFHTFRREITVIDNIQISYPDIMDYHRNGNIKLGINGHF
jgi:hypothetical protein